ncbi:uncharacterized protein CANTADRAFT_29373, partial [Suhomyces tanzawaensis NRRL Y-17324]
IKQLSDLENTNSADRQAILQLLPPLVREVGVDSNDIQELIELITSNLISTADQSYIIEEILVPSKSSQLPVGVIYQIVSQIGIPQVYHKNGRKTKLKKLSKGVQIKLLEWLICSIHLFGAATSKTLQRMLPILFNYLSYEYLRPYISNLIFLGVVGGSSNFRTLYNQHNIRLVPTFKAWHIQLVVDLYVKFPTDEYLRALLILFKSLDPQINLHDYSRNLIFDTLKIGPVSPNIFLYPNAGYLNKLNGVDSTTVLNVVLNHNLKEYSEFGQTIKRRKLNRAPIQNETTIVFDNIDISTQANQSTAYKLRNNQDLIANLADARSIKINDLFQSKDSFTLSKLRKLMVILQINADKSFGSNLHKKLDHYVKLSLIDDNLTCSELEKLCDEVQSLMKFSAGTLDLPLVEELVLYQFDFNPILILNEPQQRELNNLNQRLKFLRFLPIKSFDSLNLFLKPTLEIFERNSRNKLLTHKLNVLLLTFIQQLILMFEIWIVREVDRPIVFDTVDKTISSLYDFFTNHIKEYGSSSEYMIISIFKFVKSIDLDILNEHFSDNAVVPPKVIVYRLLFKGDPFLISELCGFIAHTKSYYFKKDQMKALQNSYIMDIVNFLWRDKALHQENNLLSSSRGFFLHPDFQPYVSSLHVFNYSNMITLSTIGNLFVNPAWAYLSAQIVWKLEDQSSEVTTRHQGPVSKESILRLQTDTDSLWLSVSYDDLKLKVLRELDALGFTGLADLMFNSLKTLQNQR